MKKINLILALPLMALIFLITACATPVEQEDEVGLIDLIDDQEVTSLEFETLAQSTQSPYESEGHYVITNEEDLADLELDELADKVNFEEEMILAVFMGERTTGGYSIEIVEIVEMDDVIEVLIEETSPGEDDMVTMALTYPEHIVKMEKTEKPIEFIK